MSAERRIEIGSDQTGTHDLPAEPERNSQAVEIVPKRALTEADDLWWHMHMAISNGSGMRARERLAQIEAQGLEMPKATLKQWIKERLSLARADAPQNYKLGAGRTQGAVITELEQLATELNIDLN